VSYLKYGGKNAKAVNKSKVFLLSQIKSSDRI
jgi:hypothetical protein